MIRAEQKAADAAVKKRDRQHWQEAFDHDSIDLRGLPRGTVKKSRKILKQLEQGTAYHQLRGTRLSVNRLIVRIPVGQNYRMVCDDIDGQIVPRKVIPHKCYDKIVNNKTG